MSVHPRTRERLDDRGTRIDESLVRLVEPLGLFDFVHLEQKAKCVLSDSGTVQEESCLFGVPNVTLRDVTERPETLEAGSNILTGANRASVETCVALALAGQGEWEPPREYLATNVSRIVAKILMSHRLAEPR